MNSLPNRVAYFCLIFLLLYGPVINIGWGPYADIQILLSIMLCAYASIRYSLAEMAPDKVSSSLAIILLLLIGYGLASSLIDFVDGESLYFHVALRPLRALGILVGCYVAVVIGKNWFGTQLPSVLLLSMFWVISIHGFIMILQFVSPDLRDAISRWTFADEVAEVNQTIRMPGLTRGGGSPLSVFQAVGVLLIPFLLIDNSTYFKKWLMILCGLICFWSIVLSGRSGIWLVVIALPIAIALLYRVKGSLVVFIGLLAVGVPGVIVLFYAGDSMASYFGGEAANFFDVAAARSFQTFRGEDETIDTLLASHFFIPDDFQTFMFGNPRLIELDQGDSNRIIDSDVGYVRLLFGYGILGSLLHYVFYLIIVIQSYRLIGFDRRLAVFCLLFGLAMLVFNGKEVFVFARIGLSITLLTFFCLLKKKRE